MSGIEIAGVLLGTFPLIVSGLEHWRDMAKVGGFFWKVRKEYTKCQRNVEFHEIQYKRNLKELLLPIISDADEVTRLIKEPGGTEWSDKSLQSRLEDRLQESHSVYMGIIRDMNEAAEELMKELYFDKVAVQDNLSSLNTKTTQKQRPSLKKSNLEFQLFRVKFSLGEPVRDALFEQLKQGNDRLQQLLNTSDKISTLQAIHPSNKKYTSTLETSFQRARKKSALLFKALQKAWQCSCQQYHFANLKLEHRTLPEIYFETILLFAAQSSQSPTPWSWREIQCGPVTSCPSQKLTSQPSAISAPTPPAPASLTSPKIKKVAFIAQLSLPTIASVFQSNSSIKLCQSLSDPDYSNCMGNIGHDDEIYHLHTSRKRIHPANDTPITLDIVLSRDFGGYLSRRQRYSIALLVASSVAQLQSTPWLQMELTKEHILFYPEENAGSSIPYGEPFIRQGFSRGASSGSPEVKEYNFYSLGILLLELCFGKRLEDQPFFKKPPTSDAQIRQACDVLAAMKWSKNVSDEGGEDYEAAVKWCFLEAGKTNVSWRSEIIRNVIRPLEQCQEHFKTATIPHA